MSGRSEQLRAAGMTAWRTAVLLVATVVVLVLFAGMGFLVYRGRMDASPFVLMTGVVLGYLLRTIQSMA